MSGTKIVIIVLVLIVVLFVVLNIWGYGKAGAKPSGNAKTDANSFKSMPHPSFLDSIYRPDYGPKLDRKQLTPKQTTFDLAQQAKYTVLVGADSEEFRKAKVTMQNACAEVDFQANDGPNDLRAQGSETKGVDKNNFTLTVPKGGGTLTISRRFNNNAPCTVMLQ